MANSTDFKLLFEKYQEDGIKQGISIVKYCQMNGVVLPVEIVDAGGLDR